MSDLNDLVRALQAGVNGGNDQSSIDAIDNMVNAVVKNINYDTDIRPISEETVRQKLQAFPVDITDVDIDDLVDISQSDPALFKIMYDVMARAVSVLNNTMKNGWQDEFFISSIEVRNLEADPDVSSFIEDYMLHDYCDKNLSDQFHAFWDKGYDVVTAIAVQLKRKVVYGKYQPIVSFISAHSIQRNNITSKEFLSTYRAVA